MKHLLFSLISGIIGIAIGFYVCKQTYQPQVAVLKEQVTAVSTELEEAKKNVRIVFSHNADCVVGEVDKPIE